MLYDLSGYSSQTAGTFVQRARAALIQVDTLPAPLPLAAAFNESLAAANWVKASQHRVSRFYLVL